MLLVYINLFLYSVFLGGEGMFFKGTRWSNKRCSGWSNPQAILFLKPTYMHSIGKYVLFNTNSWYFWWHVFVVLDLFLSSVFGLWLFACAKLLKTRV